MITLFRSSTVPTTAELKAMLMNHKAIASRFTRLQNYYAGKHDILNRTMTDLTKPNNLIVNNYPGYITDMLTGYFVGNPITYSSDNDKYLETLTPILEYNDEQDHNIELAKLTSINGVCYELLYQDEAAMTRFTELSPAEAFIIRNNTLSGDIIAGVRYYDVITGDKTITKVEMYDKDTITSYEYDGELKALDITEHFFRDVPFVEYVNNKEQIGDFEKVLTLVDAYDKAQSDTLNDMDQFTDAYLMLKNMGGTDSTDIASMKTDRVLLVDENGDAKWLVKDVNDAWVENFKTRAKGDIHKFSQTPDMSDENFAGTASGVALSYKLLGMEQLRKSKERKFKKGLQRRFELITNILTTKGGVFDWRTIDMQFSNTLPQNEVELATMLTKLEPFLSNETLISWLPRIQNAAEEIKKKADERDTDLMDYNTTVDKEAAAKLAAQTAAKTTQVTPNGQQ